ncbi:protein-L-isoaspartate(D-aspartate) O-methyltransferase [Geomesophilobacter sediminis]|uniref:Protein-L-isoaspartate O-methyltransferase n=1 Tax=Geomesophilobacter sediminis TaxID=2798584 RepID=A0A8J7S9J6_9BACT|nr:protein-L-isoaspartate(D-aspartate) O-methyltransferase [Geomesophilobacter sediminis]MBJ6726951.1 protein-L-isoaspartate(D-aspartate) O-methyltransferase [Geomesophilobacter sediminis]
MRNDRTRDLAEKKEHMILVHLMGRGIDDAAVLRAMREVPREEFVSPGLEASAYDDYPLPIDEGQTISQPYIVAYMTQELQLKAEDRVLEIGTGSGYQAAVLSRIVHRVYSVERLPLLADQARERLRRLGIDNVTVFCSDGTLGLPEHAPYDAMIVTAGAPSVPDALVRQLALGGRLVIPVGRSPLSQELVRVRRAGETEIRTEELCAVRFVPLVGEQGWKQ